MNDSAPIGPTPAEIAIRKAYVMGQEYERKCCAEEIERNKLMGWDALTAAGKDFNAGMDRAARVVRARQFDGI